MPAPSRPVQSSKMQTPNKPSLRASRTTVLHLCADLEPGDPARAAVELAVLTQRAGWRALIASRGGLLVPEAERAAVRHTKMPLDADGALASFRNRIRLAALVQKERPVILHAHGIEPVRHALTVARIHRMPLVADFTRPLPEQPRVRRLLKKLEKITSAVRVPSEYMATQLRETFQWPASRLQVIAPGIDTKWCDAATVSAERLQALSRLWRLPEQEAVIVMPMPFMPRGGHAQLLEALAPLKNKGVFAVLVGDNRPQSGYHREIEALIDKHGLDGKVIMPDYCLDWPAACWLANAVVTPNTVPRGQAFELLIAQSIGRPVIVSDSGANREMVPGPETAWMVPPDDTRALAEALRTVIGLDTNRRLILARQARDFVVEAFPQAAWFNAMMDLYDSLLITRVPRVAAQAA